MIVKPKSLYGRATLGLNKIKKKYLGVHLGPQKPYAYAPSNFKEDFNLSLGKQFLFVKLLRPFVSVNSDFLKHFLLF
jgi:hypothetical protein